MFTTKIGSVARLVAFALVSVSAVACSGAPQSFDPAGDVSEEDALSRSAKFQTFVGMDGQHYFNLVAANGQNVLRSEGYKTAAGADSAIASVVSNGIDYQSYRQLQAKNGEWYFNIVAGNGEIIATSETYATKSNATRAAKTVRTLIGRLGAVPTIEPAPLVERFEVFTGEDKQSYFHLRAKNGEIVLASEGYASRSAAQQGVQSVMNFGKTASQYDVFETANGQWGVRLRANNGQVIARGESYVSKSGAEGAVAAMVKLLSDGAPVTAN